MADTVEVDDSEYSTIEKDSSNASDETKASSHSENWLNRIIPHLSIRPPSPSTSVPLPWNKHYKHHKHEDSIDPVDSQNEDCDSLSPERVQKCKAQPSRQFTKSARPKARRMPTATSVNRLQLSRTVSDYPESVHPHTPTTVIRFQNFQSSLAVRQMSQFISMKDEFDCLDGQDIVLLDGYRGSILRDARTHRRLWVPLVKGGLNLRKVDLSLPLDEDAEEHAEKTIFADKMLTELGPIDFSNRLIARLKTLEKQGKCRLHTFGYDWRLSLHTLSHRFQKFLESLPSNQGGNSWMTGALVIAHSMGGLVAHHAMQMRPELFYGTVYVGTPFSHCVNILGPFKRGDSFLANREILSASVNFTMRSSFVFLPESGECFIDRKTHRKLLIDFFDYKNWLDYGLSPCVSDVGEHHHENQFEYTAKEVVGTLRSIPNLIRLLEPHLHEPPTSGAKPSKLQHNREKAVEYLKRTLEQTWKFKQELKRQPDADFDPPPLAVVYAVNTVTVKGAIVDGEEGIKSGDWWDFAYGPGDGVVLAKSAQLPEGFSPVAKIKSKRGHVQLLNDWKAVGKAIHAVVMAKRERDAC